MSEPLMLRVPEAAAMLAISRAKSYELIRRGELPSVRIDGCVRVPVEALRRWIDIHLNEQPVSAASIVEAE
jgi:excisionase family DNA binding protein